MRSFIYNCQYAIMRATEERLLQLGATQPYSLGVETKTDRDGTFRRKYFEDNSNTFLLQVIFDGKTIKISYEH